MIPLPPFLGHFFQNIWAKHTVLNTKNLQLNFWIKNDPLPWDLLKRKSKSEITGAPMRGVLKKGESATWEKFSYKYVQIITTTFIFDKVFCLKVKCCQICILFTQ